MVFWWALVGAVVATGAGAAVGIGAYWRQRRILRRGAVLTAAIVASEVVGRKVRLSLRFEGIEEHVLEFLGYRLRPEDAAALVPGVPVRAWVLPADLSEIRLAYPGSGRMLPFQLAPEVSGHYPDGGLDGLGSLLDHR
ncbi:hypothetical protein AB0M46_51020 [Dactylosporangium sp. NPDC051485]|uniref:hypothetical protein n=1 Tax=Dactylosporangium sp. NPDC051485 TaxID=3154846 RepID=UPI0034337564